MTTALSIITADAARKVRRVILLIGIIISFSILLPGLALSATIPDDTTHHNQNNSPCQDCHKDDIALSTPDQSKQCSACHDQSPVPTDSLLKPAIPDITFNDSPYPPGMSLPMYYSPSRLGDKPNTLIKIPAGPFIMGSNTRLADEGPQHERSLPSYYIDEHEVTNAQYKAFIDATGRRSPSHFRNRTFPNGKSDHPVSFVSWHDANAYCQWSNKRLPTEAEWEKAARGPKSTIFPWGNKFNVRLANTPVRWAALRQTGDTTPVGAFKGGASAYGLKDMSGNVWEWTASWYQAHPGNTTTSENFGKIYKVLKGGSWWDCTFYQCGISAPAFNRSFFNPRVKNSSFGFRCAANTAAQQP